MDPLVFGGGEKLHNNQVSLELDSVPDLDMGDSYCIGLTCQSGSHPVNNYR